MSDLLFPTQQALFAALGAYAPLQALIGNPVRLYDHAPPSLVFPYVTFGALHIAPYDSVTDNGFAQTVTFDIWSRYRGAKEAKAITEVIYNALHRANLIISGGTLALCAFHSADIAPLDDGLTTHAAARFTVAVRG